MNLSVCIFLQIKWISPKLMHTMNYYSRSFLAKNSISANHDTNTEADKIINTLQYMWVKYYYWFLDRPTVLNRPSFMFNLSFHCCINFIEIDKQ